MLELWAPVPEAPDYEVSTWGRLRRADAPVVSWPNKYGYELVSLDVDGRCVLRYVHRLVLAAFVEPPAGRQANHDDGDKGHNALENLAWTTPAGNIAHAWRRGLMPRSRTRKAVCRYGHPLDQAYHQRDRHGRMRTWYRCARCRRVRYRRARAAAAGLGWLFPTS
jgi:hypothetical protein